MSTAVLSDIKRELEEGKIVPYLGPGLLDLMPACPVPVSPEALVEKLVAKASVPHKIRKNLTAAAQFIENFKHRKTVTQLMSEAFQADVAPTLLHRYLADLSELPLVVDMWYDNAMQNALAARNDWGMVQGVSQSEHFGTWVHYFDDTGAPADEARAADWTTLVYQPLGSIAPAANFLVSDTDFVEVLTEIDIQTPIPAPVQERRRDRHFLFLGCRFNTQLDRMFARQIMKRSSDKHWALLEGELTRNETRFLAEQNIERIDMSLAEFQSRAAHGQAAPLATAV